MSNGKDKKSETTKPKTTVGTKQESRRKFLSGSAVAGAAVAATGLSACAGTVEEKSSSNQNIDKVIEDFLKVLLKAKGSAALRKELAHKGDGKKALEREDPSQRRLRYPKHFTSVYVDYKASEYSLSRTEVAKGKYEYTAVLPGIAIDDPNFGSLKDGYMFQGCCCCCCN